MGKNQTYITILNIKSSDIMKMKSLEDIDNSPRKKRISLRSLNQHIMLQSTHWASRVDMSFHQYFKCPSTRPKSSNNHTTRIHYTKEIPLYRLRLIPTPIKTPYKIHYHISFDSAILKAVKL